MSTLDVMLEAEKRGILPPEKQGLLEEARRRNLAPSLGLSPPSPTMGEITSDVGEQSVRGINRGMNSVLSLPGAIVGGAVDGANWVLDKSAGVQLPVSGDDFRWKNSFSDFMESPNAKAKTTAGRYADAVGQAIGGSAAPTAGVLAKANQVAGPAARTTIGSLGQQVVEAARRNPGIAVSTDATAAAGAGIGQQVAEEGGYGVLGQTVGGLVGAMTPAAFSKVTDGITRPIRRAIANQGETGAYNTIASKLPDGSIDQFADDVAVGASGLSDRVQRRTLDILGDEMQRSGGNVRRAEAAAVARIAAEFGVTPSTAQNNLRNLRSVHSNSQLMLGEYPSVARSDVDFRNSQAPSFDDLNRVEKASTQGAMDYLLNNGSTPSAKAAGDAILRRHENLSPAIRETLERTGPQINGRPAAITDTPVMVEAARTAARADYRAAAHNQRPFSTNLDRVLSAWNNQIQGRSSDVARKMGEATDLFVDHIQTVNPNGKNGPVSLRTVSDIQDFINRRTQLNRMIDDSYVANPQTGTDDPTAVTHWLERFKRHVDAAVGANNPQWRVANRRWADMNLERRAQRLGDVFATSAGPQYRAQIEEFQQLAPQAQNIVRIHFLQKIYDRLENLPDTNSVSKLFSKDHSRNMVEAMFGRDAAEEFTRSVRDSRVAESSTRMMGDTRTASRLANKEQMEPEQGILGSLSSANGRGLLNWVGKQMAQLASERRNHPMADILTTPMSDTARVAQHINAMRSSQQRINGISNPPPRAPGAIGRVAPEVNIEPKNENEAKKKPPVKAPGLGAKPIQGAKLDETRVVSQAREAVRNGASREQVTARMRLLGMTPPPDL